MNHGFPGELRIALLLLFCCLLACTAYAQTSVPKAGCWPATGAQFEHDTTQLGRGLVTAPRNAIRPRNLKWELPIAAATGLMIAELDAPVARHNQSLSRQNLASKWSNIGLGIELGSAGLMWAVGCAHHHDTLRDTGWTALEAAGAAAGIDEVFKIAANRQYPNAINGNGEFWEKGKSFPSGHSAASWAVAAVLARRYPHKHWLVWTAYGMATAVSLSRIPAKKHFPSDILVGSTIGYVTGAYLAGH